MQNTKKSEAILVNASAKWIQVWKNANSHGPITINVSAAAVSLSTTTANVRVAYETIPTVRNSLGKIVPEQTRV